MLVTALINRIAKEFPNKTINIAQEYFTQAPIFGNEREIIKTWCLYIDGVANEEFDTFDEMIDFVNCVLKNNITRKKNVTKPRF